MAYGTAIEPAWKPPQKNDLDDGVYVRTSFLSHQEPGLESARYFQLVEKALQRLCDRRGWALDTSKDTCVRVWLNVSMYIDLPLYAIPDEEFLTLVDAVRNATGDEFEVALNRFGHVLNSHRDIRIPRDRVMLAHRKEGWILSDPRLLHDWFENQVERFGPQLRREWRYAKGWRDFIFKDGGPSSLTMMVCAVNRYRETDWQAADDRDDLSLHSIASGLPDMFREKIPNPVVSGAPLLNDWSDLERQRIVNAAAEFAQTIDRALNGTHHADVTVDQFRRALGARR